MSLNKETIEKFKKFEKDINAGNDSIEKISELRVQVVVQRAGKIKQKPIWNFESYIQLTVHRVYDFAIQSTNAWNDEIPVAAFILTCAMLNAC